MSDFTQDRFKITNFHILQPNQRHLQKEILKQSKSKKVALIVPVLASEYNRPENAEAFNLLLRQLQGANYLSHIIFGLDKATYDDALKLRELIKQRDLQNCLVHWNDGPLFQSFYEELSNAGFNIAQPGKGKNMFLSFGLAIALKAQKVALLDADIKTFRLEQLNRLLYPVVVHDYEFSKAYYSRIGNSVMYGRVKRLMLDPLLMSLKRKFTESNDEKMLKLIDFLLAFKYQLSGEVAFDANLMKKMNIATNWGVEIYTLIEVYRKASTIAQVDFSSDPFDHKHQEVSPEDSSTGLHRMAVDIVATLLNALVIEEGLEVSETFFRDLSITYTAMAESQIKKYSDDASFNKLDYDREAEEDKVRNVFRNAIMCAGDLLTSPYRMTERFLRFALSFEEFKPFMDQGLAEAILSVESKNRQLLFEMPQTVSWEWVASKQPKIFERLLKISNEEEERFK